jgi:GntR family transcriptional regulator
MDSEDEGTPRVSRMEYAFAQVADDVQRRIVAGEWSYGDQLPVREDLAAEYGVGEMTVRRAMRELRDRGYVRPLPSKGTFVVWRAGPDPPGAGAGHEPGT